ncbi:LacI family DNA-binding transcriptional regulator [Rathayibacter oskolensis]|uniref:LacI family DNA-binding transcriptional regulator n=1 Tax=Rathayibacter oskolensis TaxID=1891671 RepID=UPI0034677577
MLSSPPPPPHPPSRVRRGCTFRRGARAERRANLGRMRATVRDVATRAGVSPKTVSNVINGVVFVRPGTRERVEAAIADLHYVPNLSARGLRNGRSGAVALAFPDLTTEYSAAMLDNFVEAAHERGWSIQMEQTGRRPDREGELLSRAREHLIDGLILNPVSLKLSAIVGAAELPPIVVIGEVEQDLVDRVAVDSVAAAREMTEHLLARGHRRIAVVGTDGPGSDRASARARTQGYREALAAAGVPNDPALEIMTVDWVPSVAGEAFARALDAGVEMDAVFCFTDSMAVGVPEHPVRAAHPGAGADRRRRLRRRARRPLRVPSADHGVLRQARLR